MNTSLRDLPDQAFKEAISDLYHSVKRCLKHCRNNCYQDGWKDWAAVEDALLRIDQLKKRQFLIAPEYLE